MSERNNTLAVSNATILVIDDTPQNLKMVDVILSQAGYNVVRANSATAAYQSLATSLPDLILLDVVMPDKDGYTVCQELKSRPETSDIPIIFLSGLSDPMDKVKGFSAGGADFVSKPSACCKSALSSCCRLAGTIRSLIDFPTASSVVYPNVVCAPGFQ